MSCLKGVSEIGDKLWVQLDEISMAAGCCGDSLGVGLAGSSDQYAG